jgi:hypothetical protein
MTDWITDTCPNPFPTTRIKAEFERHEASSDGQPGLLDHPRH